MDVRTEGVHEYRKLWLNSRFTKVRRQRELVNFFGLCWLTLAFSVMAAEDEITSAPRHIYLPDLSILEEIVKGTTGIFRDDDEEEQCRRMVEALSEQEQAMAASSSYAYWAWEKIQALDSGSSLKDKDDVRIRMAMREARRHFVGQNGNFDVASERLKHTVQWREESKIDLLRCCFAQSTAHSVTSTGIPTTAISLSVEDVQFCIRMERLIERDLSSQTMVIRGHDRLNRPIILRFPRRREWSIDSDASCNEDEDSFLWAQLYIAERAIAAAEIHSRGQSELLTVLFDFGSYDSKNAPPVGVMIRTVTVLQANYPERLGKAVVMDVPFWINAVITLVQPFLSAKTREKLVVLGSTSLLPASLWRPFSSSADSMTSRDATLRELVDADQAMPLFRDDGNLKSDIDIAHFLRNIPFYELYDFGDTAISITES